MYRYCPDCDKWLETSEYTVDETGETMCPEHETYVHGSLQGKGYGEYPLHKSQFFLQNQRFNTQSKEYKAAKRQRLVV